MRQNLQTTDTTGSPFLPQNSSFLPQSIAAIGLVLALGTGAAHAEISELATGNGFSFTGVNDNSLLTVSCDDGAYQQMHFSAGQAPAFEPVDADGVWPDAVCKYELRTQPANGEVPEVYSGSFDILSGVASLPEKTGYKGRG